MQDFTLKNVHLRNFRGYEDLSITFEDDFTVLVGRNGSGKTATLDALRILFSTVLSKFNASEPQPDDKPKEPLRLRQSVPSRDIRNGATYANIGCTFNFSGLTYTLNHDIGEWFDPLPQTKDDSDNFLAALTERTRDIHHKKNKIGLPIIVAYGIERNNVDVPARIRTQHTFTPIETYDESLEPSTSFRLFFEWFRLEEDIENELKARPERADALLPLSTTPDDDALSECNLPYKSRPLEAVRTALEKHLPTFENFRITRDPLGFWADKNGTPLLISQFSDGERALMALVGDIARRLCVANPHSEHPLLGSGIVLVDEIDLHLHPIWQERTVASLTKTFPNIQFVFTTHSPQILSTVHRRHIRLLSLEEGAATPEASWGLTATEILEEIMGAQRVAPDFQEKLVKLEELIASEDFTLAQQLIEELKEAAGELPPSALPFKHTLDFKKHMSHASNQ